MRQQTLPWGRYCLSSHSSFKAGASTKANVNFYHVLWLHRQTCSHIRTPDSDQVNIAGTFQEHTTLVLRVLRLWPWHTHLQTHPKIKLQRQRACRQHTKNYLEQAIGSSVASASDTRLQFVGNQFQIQSCALIYLFNMLCTSMLDFKSTQSKANSPLAEFPVLNETWSKAQAMNPSEASLEQAPSKLSPLRVPEHTPHSGLTELSLHHRNSMVYTDGDEKPGEASMAVPGWHCPSQRPDSLCRFRSVRSRAEQLHLPSRSQRNSTKPKPLCAFSVRQSRDL